MIYSNRLLQKTPQCVELKLASAGFFVYFKKFMYSILNQFYSKFKNPLFIKKLLIIRYHFFF